MSDDDRPQAIRRPRPPADAGRDPADVAPPATVHSRPSAPAKAPQYKQAPLLLIQLNTRIDARYAQRLEEVVAEKGWTKRFAVEHAIKEAYGIADE